MQHQVTLLLNGDLQGHALCAGKGRGKVWCAADQQLVLVCGLFWSEKLSMAAGGHGVALGAGTPHLCL
jgi:hypothetical protein